MSSKILKTCVRQNSPSKQGSQGFSLCGGFVCNGSSRVQDGYISLIPSLQTSHLYLTHFQKKKKTLHLLSSYRHFSLNRAVLSLCYCEIHKEICIDGEFTWIRKRARCRLNVSVNSSPITRSYSADGGGDFAEKEKRPTSKEYTNALRSREYRTKRQRQSEDGGGGCEKKQEMGGEGTKTEA